MCRRSDRTICGVVAFISSQYWLATSRLNAFQMRTRQTTERLFCRSSVRYSPKVVWQVKRGEKERHASESEEPSGKPRKIDLPTFPIAYEALRCSCRACLSPDYLQLSTQREQFFLCGRLSISLHPSYSTHLVEGVCLKRQKTPRLANMVAASDLPAMKTNPKFIFFTDFDGTITMQDSTLCIFFKSKPTRAERNEKNAEYYITSPFCDIQY